MNENRYAPPVAEVADVERLPPPPRPRNVAFGTWSLLALYVFGAAFLLYDLIFPPFWLQPGLQTVAYNVGKSMGLGFVTFGIWVTWMAHGGRNWARIVQLLMLVFALIAAFRVIPTNFSYSMSGGLIAVFTLLLNIVPVMLRFTPSANAWYRASKAASLQGG